MSDSESVEVLKLLDTCHAIELASERLYSAFAVAHADHPTVAQLWRKTAAEEQQHAAQFRLLMSAHGSAVQQINVSYAEALKALHELELMATRARIEPPGVVDALRFAVALEDRLGGFHAHTAAVFKDAAHRKLFNAMMAADDRHTEALRDALASYEEKREPPPVPTRPATGTPTPVPVEPLTDRRSAAQSPYPTAPGQARLASRRPEK